MKIQLFLEIIILFILLLSPILSKPQENSIVIGGFPSLYLVFQLILAIFFFIRGKVFSKKEHFSYKNFFLGFILLFLLLLNMVLWNYVQSKIVLGFTGTVLINNISAFFLWINIIFGTFTAAFYEEALYRFYAPGFFLQFVAKIKNQKIFYFVVESIIILLFAFAHFHLGWIGIIHSFFAGLLLRVYVKRYNCFFVCVAVHTIFNLIQYGLLIAKS